MSRSGYSDDCANRELYRGNVDRAIAGARGQAFLKQLIAVLDAMPVKELISGEFVSDNGCCALGAICKARGIDTSDIDVETPPWEHQHLLVKRLNIAECMVAEIEWENDENGPYHGPETPADRWKRMRAWAVSHLKGERQ